MLEGGEKEGGENGGGEREESSARNSVVRCFKVLPDTHCFLLGVSQDL